MKKIIALLSVVVLVFAFSGLTVGAEPSPQTDDIISEYEVIDTDGNKVDAEIEKTKDKDKDFKPDGDDVIIGYYELKNIDKNAKYPVTVKVKVAGIKKNTGVYILVKDSAGNIKKIVGTVSSDGLIDFSLDQYYQYFCIVTDKKTATSLGVSDKTGDLSTAVAGMTLCLSLAFVAVAYKKVSSK